MSKPGLEQSASIDSVWREAKDPLRRGGYKSFQDAFDASRATGNGDNGPVVLGCSDADIKAGDFEAFVGAEVQTTRLPGAATAPRIRTAVIKAFRRKVDVVLPHQDCKASVELPETLGRHPDLRGRRAAVELRHQLGESTQFVGQMPINRKGTTATIYLVDKDLPTIDPTRYPDLPKGYVVHDQNETEIAEHGVAQLSGILAQRFGDRITPDQPTHIVGITTPRGRRKMTTRLAEVSGIIPVQRHIIIVR